MQCPALGKVPGNGNDELTIKATATGITFLHERRFKTRYNGSKTCAVGINGEVWPKRQDYLKMQALKIPSRLISYSINGLHYLDPVKYIKETTPKRKKKAGMPACLDVKFDKSPGSALHASSDEIIIPENFSGENALKVANITRKKSYSINKKEVRQRIMTYINTAKGQKELYFWTVSFPEGTPDDTCYKAFNTWLTTLRTRQKDRFGKLMPALLKDYLWIAERQMGDRLTTDKQPTYTIHFHIAIPHFMPVTRCNAAMRTILKNLAKKGEMPGAICKGKKETYYLPSIARYNGVHIGRDRKGKVINFAIKRASRALAGYLTKYITKNDAGVADESGNVAVPGFDRLAWHNSRGFSCLFTGVCFSVKEFTSNGFRPLLNRLRIFQMEFATFIPWLYGPPHTLMDHLFQLNSYIQTIQDGKAKVHTAGSTAVDAIGPGR